MSGFSEADQAEIAQVTKDILNFLGERNVRPTVAHAALLSTVLEIMKAFGSPKTIEDAERELIEYIRRDLAAHSN